MENFLKWAVTSLLFIILAAIFITGASNVNKLRELKANSTEINNVEQQKVKIGFAMGTLKEERWIKDRDILMAKVKELGAEILVQNANNDDRDQLEQVKYLLDQDIDVLIIVPNDLEKASDAVKLAKNQGVKVISYDRLVLKSNVDLYISFDNTKVGELMASYLIERVPRGNYAIINGPHSDNNTKMIKEGYDKILLPQVQKENIKIISEVWSDNWMAEYAFEVTDEMLQQGHKIDAIIAGNDSLADGIIKVLAENRMAGKTVVVGQDADLAACQRIVEGTQLMTVYKPIEGLASETAKIAIKLAKGERFKVHERINDGKYEVPYYILEPLAVDKDNIDETIIKDGFHIREEVYR